MKSRSLRRARARLWIPVLAACALAIAGCASSAAGNGTITPINEGPYSGTPATVSFAYHVTNINTSTGSATGTFTGVYNDTTSGVNFRFAGSPSTICAVPFGPSSSSGYPNCDSTVDQVCQGAQTQQEKQTCIQALSSGTQNGDKSCFGAYFNYVVPAFSPPGNGGEGYLALCPISSSTNTPPYVSYIVVGTGPYETYENTGLFTGKFLTH